MDLVERLTQHKILGSAPREELAWLAEHGVLRSLKVGDVLSHKGQPVEGMYPVLSGRLAIFVDGAIFKVCSLGRGRAVLE